MSIPLPLVLARTVAAAFLALTALSEPVATAKTDGEEGAAAVEPSVRTQDAEPVEAENGPEGESASPSVVEIKRLEKARWIRHEILPGERLDDIAARYEVKRKQLIKWNKLNPDKPMIRSGARLRVYTKIDRPERRHVQYVVRSGDTWDSIAKKHGVDSAVLRQRWNRKVPRRFKAGTILDIWMDDAPTPVLNVPKSDAALPLLPIDGGAISIGKPNSGRIQRSVQLPKNDELYTRRKPEEAFGSSHAVYYLQLAIARWRRDSGYTGALKIGSISKQGGGRLRPHRSHQSGRDADVQLPVLDGLPRGKRAENSREVDWDATWALVRALIDTGEVQYIFLETGRQKHLRKAAMRAGVSDADLAKWIQFPAAAKTNKGIVRHSPGHTAHIHVRFTCAEGEARCLSY